MKGHDCSSELFGLDDVITRPMRLAQQYGVSLGKVRDLLAGIKCAPQVGIWILSAGERKPVSR